MLRQQIRCRTASLSNINVVSGWTKLKIQNQDVSPFAELKKQICNVKIEPSKSIDLVLEKGEKTNKAGGKKLKSKSTLAEPNSSSVQS
ncbi:hypothetical protein GLOIN_2v1765586 [Rhizophagus clarus]|uniref:Uncharacterized protein n=1 Tax=Rhizophagus clarus TaxID=94130 RepID=A0A8H3R0S1_9GLOM|nr:hypothetical protein GLOIN_2v1765586 [Rhizophagus clarus]